MMKKKQKGCIGKLYNCKSEMFYDLYLARRILTGMKSGTISFYLMKSLFLPSSFLVMSSDFTSGVYVC